MNRLILSLLCGFAVCLAALESRASDGVIEINHARALAGGVTPGDGPGYPVTITGPGSYILTGELTPAAGQRGITMNGSQITLDLNGFGIRGTAVCTGFPVTSCTGHGGEGIYAGDSSASEIVVRNGTVQGMNEGMYIAGSASTIEDVAAIGNSVYGISVGDRNSVRNCRVGSNGLGGIYGGAGVEVLESEVHGNRRFGIQIGSGSIVSWNRVYSNELSGIYLLPPGSLEHNVVEQNGTAGTGVGIFANTNVNSNTRVRIDGNVFANNSGGDLGWVGASSPFLSTNTNVCTTAAC
jgi:hypothetical protein